MSDTHCNCSISPGDYEAPKFSTETMRVARKVHRCCECHKDIQVGDQYFVATHGKLKKTYTVREVVGITKGQYGNESYAAFFARAGKEE